MPDFFSPQVLITAAGTLQILSFLLINQTYLRLCMLVGSLFYIAYYATVGPAPLWEAITLTSLTVVAIILGLVGLYARNSRWAIPRAHADLAGYFANLLPGDFRLLMRHAERFTVTEDTTVTQQGQKPKEVYFVVDGTYQVTKANHTFIMYGPTFVGEVAYLLDRPSVATTILPAGLEVVRWDASVLARNARTKPRFKLALDAVISRDLANKVALAVAPSK